MTPNHKVKKRTSPRDDDDARIKIMFTLLHSIEPLRLMDISRESKVSEPLVFHHLKRLKEQYLVAEVDDKTYVAQPFFYDENVMEILNNQMKSIILTILRELQENQEYTEEILEEAIKNNLEIFIQTFAVEIMK